MDAPNMSAFIGQLVCFIGQLGGLISKQLVSEQAQTRVGSSRRMSVRDGEERTMEWAEVV
jgi:hypothetical protein